MANRYSIETIFRAVDRITAPVSRMQRRIRDFTERAQRGISRVSDVTLRLTQGMAAVGGAALGAFMTAAGGVALFVSEVNQANAEMANMSKAMGVSLDATRAMDGFLANTTMNWENFTDQIEEMRNKFGEMKGAGEMKSLNEALGVANLKWKDLKNLSPEKQYIKIMDTLVKMKDAQKAAFVADTIFGGEGNKITGLLRARGMTMTQVIEEYKKYNFYTEEAQKASEDFNKAMSPIQQMATSIKSQIAALIGGALVPYIQKATEWATANKDVIQSKIAEYAQKIADSFAWLVTNMDEILYWSKMFAIAIGIFLVLAVVLKTFVLVMTAVNLVMAMNPIVLIVLAVIALIAVVTYIISRFVGWEKALKIVGTALLLLMGPIGWLILAGTQIYKNWDKLKAFFVNLWSSIVGTFQSAKDMIAGIIDWIMNKVTGVITAVSNIANKVKGFFGFGGGQGVESAGAAVSSPQNRISQNISETTNRSEVTITDTTGRAKMTGNPGRGVLLKNSGGM